MPGFPAPFIKFREDDANGLPLAGGQLFSYAAGTASPLATYTTQALDVPNTNPVILDASGRASVFIHDGVGYKFILLDALGNHIWTVDNVQVPQIAVPAAAAEVPTGGIAAYGGLSAPSGWLLCDGTGVSTATYAALFAVLQYRFGGAGALFNLPNLTQRFPLGFGASTGAPVGSTGGTFGHTHSGPAHTHGIPAHTHGVPVHSHGVPFNGWGNVTNTPPAAGVLQVGGSGAGTESSVTQATGNSTTLPSPAANTEANTIGLATDSGGSAATGAADPPYLVVNFIIKA